MRNFLSFLAAIGCGTSRFSFLVADAYPMIVEVAEESERCVHLTIPQDDDAHLALLAIPGLAAERDEENPNWVNEQKEIEEHFVHQMAEMQKYRVRSTLPRKFASSPPEPISKLMTKFLNDRYDGETKAGCKVTVSNPTSRSSRVMESFWFTPVVINHIRESIREKADHSNQNPLEGYEVCFENVNEDSPVLMVIESVLVSDDTSADADEEKVAVFDSSHLTPLAEQLSESIESANSIINEMRYMERRERRMRQTADSINSRVKYFSYISVAILMVVTFVQVNYLKRYFRKKKLL